MSQAKRKRHGGSKKLARGNKDIEGLPLFEVGGSWLLEGYRNMYNANSHIQWEGSDENNVHGTDNPEHILARFLAPLTMNN